MIHRVFSFSTWNPSGLHGFWWEISCSFYWGFLIHDECLLFQLSRSSLSFGSLTVLCCLRVYPLWSSLSLWGVWMDVCHQMWEVCRHFLFKYSFCPFSVLLLGLLLYIYWYIGWCSTRRVHWTFSILFIFCSLDQKSWLTRVHVHTLFCLHRSAFEPLWWFHLPHNYSFELQNFYLIPFYNFVSFWYSLIRSDIILT